MGLFDSVFKLGKGVVDIVTAPVEIAVDAARVVVAPVAEVAKEVAKEANSVANEIEKDVKDTFK